MAAQVWRNNPVILPYKEVGLRGQEGPVPAESVEQQHGVLSRSLIGKAQMIAAHS